MVNVDWPGPVGTMGPCILGCFSNAALLKDVPESHSGILFGLLGMGPRVVLGEEGSFVSLFHWLVVAFGCFRQMGAYEFRPCNMWGQDDWSARHHKDQRFSR